MCNHHIDVNTRPNLFLSVSDQRRLCSFRLRALVLMALIAPMPLMAEQTGDDVKYSFKGALLALPQCQVSNEAVINVRFGNVGINKVDSGQYIQPIDYTLDCGSATAANTVSLVFKATTVTSDGTSLITNLDGLVVKILQDGQPMTLNKKITINLGSPPKLEARLERVSGKELVESPFTATGTLVAEYF
ncbi:fimbrial protein [Buttiauxella sp. B2]|uniref:fimbrial protein n=1 Tax=Buttiauxella sp. B2 TaxID=2587812 RepID=UPI0011211AB9|nr:fimbrial protein [Buttiauxella sp. B2]TNV22516.1 fimbrial protein [Buttiauxella sp. B2]